MNILGINIYGHDTAAAIVVDGKLIGAVEEERFTRIKHDNDFPVKAIDYCMREAGIGINDIDYIAVSRDPKRLFTEKYLKYTLDNFPKANEIFLQSIDKFRSLLNIENEIREKTGYEGKIEFLNHHLCHFASSYYLSGFDEAALVSVDGLGEIESTVIGHARGKEIRVLKNINYPHSLGMLYTAITYYLGYTPNSAEGTVMALASYGDEHEEVLNGKSYIDIFMEIVQLKDEGSYELELDYFNFPYTKTGWVSDKFIETFGKRRDSGEPISRHHQNIAAALQRRYQEVYLHIMNYAQRATNSKNLSLAGGCALNCVANGMIPGNTDFQDMYIQPATTDSGTSIGAALYLSHQYDKKAELTERRKETYLGPLFSNKEIEDVLKRHNENGNSKISSLKVEDPSLEAARLLAEGKIIGWFQGRMEFGPRALGNRSILSRPYPAEAKDRINNEVKHREPFRPFAPSILKEHAAEYFDTTGDSHFMLMASKAREDKENSIIAAIHHDKTGRLHTVEKSLNEKYYNLIKYFYELTGVPLIINTSFNDKGEPVVCTPEDALVTFHKTNIDALIIGDYVVKRVEAESEGKGELKYLENKSLSKEIEEHDQRK